MLRLRLDSIWSPNLVPEDTGVPHDIHHCQLYMKTKISDKEGHFKVFTFQVCTPSTLSEFESGNFLKYVLVLEKFDWQAIQKRIKGLVEDCEDCTNWNEAITALASSLEYKGE
ncbi:MAG: hypothetical protein COA79_18705 [Planctomycetota bacterium]|nr:MAG: hypothetical protein COA79_18705 [Planctomycetota bacterium]